MAAPTLGLGQPDPLRARSARRSLWRSGMFWRMMRGPLVAFVAMLATAALSIMVVRSLVQETNSVQQTFQASEKVSRFSGSLDRAYDTLNLLIFPNYQSRFYVIVHQALDEDRFALNSLSVPSAVRADFNQLKSRFDALNDPLTALNDLAGSDQAKANAMWQGPPENYRAQVRDLADLAHRVGADLGGASSATMNGMAATQRGIEIAIPLISAAGLLLGLLLTILMLQGAVRRITGISDDLARLSDGDLTAPGRFLTTGAPEQDEERDEVRGLERSYVKTVGKLRAPLQQIQADASRISATSSEISAAASHQASGSQQQATAITEVTVTVEQLNQTAVQIADAAASVADAAEQALVSASRGQEAVRDSILGMAMIRSRVNDITARILALSAQSQRISDIIDVIDEMAGRTHILALNAAVESAGAGGEIGERFGVVASEVKKLAQRSAAATREVRTVIAQVQAATNAAVMATEDGLKETEKGVQMAHQSGDANEDIIQMVERTAQLANAISLATQQQRTASEQVVATMREIAQVTRQSAATSQQASRAASDLSDIAHELRAVAEGFHIGEEPDSGSAPGAAPRPAPGLATA